MTSQIAAASCNPGQAGLNLFDCTGLGTGQSVADVYSTPAVLVNVIVNNLFVLAGIILFVMLFYSGFKFIQQGAKGKDEAKQIITTALVGMVVMFVAFWIVQIIEIMTGTNILL